MNNYETELKIMELKALCWEICDKKNASHIYHRLLRAGVYSIDDLKCLDITTQRLTGIGEMRLEFIKELILTIGDEEKIRKIMENDSDITRLRKDSTLYEKIQHLHSVGYSDIQIAKTLGLRETTVMRLT